MTAAQYLLSCCIMAGPITLVGLAVWVVLAAIFPQLHPKFRNSTPLEQNLILAGNGVALISIVVTLVWFVPWLQQLFRHAGIGIGLALAFAGDLPGLPTDLSNLQPVFDNPGAHWPIIVAAALFACGVVHFIKGARFCWGCGEGNLRGRALFKTALGIGGGWFLWTHQDGAALSNEWLAYGWIVLFLVCLWWTLAGATRVVLTTVGGGGALGSTWDYIRHMRVRWGSAGVAGSGSAAAGSGFWGVCKRFFNIVNKIVLWGMMLFVAGGVLLFVGYILVTPHSFEEIFLGRPATSAGSPPASSATPSPAPRALLINPYPRQAPRKTE